MSRLYCKFLPWKFKEPIPNDKWSQYNDSSKWDDFNLIIASVSSIFSFPQKRNLYEDLCMIPEEP